MVVAAGFRLAEHLKRVTLDAMNRLASSARPGLAIMLVVALIYQTGACPCGCWDSSLWRVLLHEFRHLDDTCFVHRQTPSHRHRTEPSVSEDSAPELAVQRSSTDHDCERDAKAIRSQSSRDIRLRFGGKAITQLPTVSLSRQISSRSIARALPTGVPPKCQTRALLQVFQL